MTRPALVLQLDSLVALAHEDGTQVRPLKHAVSMLPPHNVAELLVLACVLLDEQGWPDAPSRSQHDE